MRLCSSSGLPAPPAPNGDAHLRHTAGARQLLSSICGSDSAHFTAGSLSCCPNIPISRSIVHQPADFGGKHSDIHKSKKKKKSSDAGVILFGVVMYSCKSKEPLRLNHKQLLHYLLFTQVRSVCVWGHLWLWHIPYSFFILAQRGKKSHQEWLCLLTGNTVSSQGWETASAVSAGWSHQEQNETKGHSQPWIICCCHPTPSHNPPLGDSLFGSYVMSARLWSALSILLPQYWNHAHTVWPPILAWSETRTVDQEGRVVAQALVWTAEACMLLQWPHGVILISGVSAGAKSWWRDLLLPPATPRDVVLIRQP